MKNRTDLQDFFAAREGNRLGGGQYLAFRILLAFRPGVDLQNLFSEIDEPIGGHSRAGIERSLLRSVVREAGFGDFHHEIGGGRVRVRIFDQGNRKQQRCLVYKALRPEDRKC